MGSERSLCASSITANDDNLGNIDFNFVTEDVERRLAVEHVTGGNGIGQLLCDFHVRKCRCCNGIAFLVVRREKQASTRFSRIAL